MGAATILEDSIKSSSSAFWQKIPSLPQTNALNFDLLNYNKSFVNFSIVAGALTLAYSSIYLGGKAFKYLTRSNPLPTRQQLLDKYGNHAWALITDCHHNEQYCKFLAQNGFNLILMGAEDHTNKLKEQILQILPNTPIDLLPVNWTQVEIDLKFYADLYARLEHYDIAFIIMPKFNRPKSSEPTHLEHIQPFQHIYILVRNFGSKIKWRSYRSAIIFPSYPDVDQMPQPNNGTSKALISGCDAFGRIIGYQFKGTVDVVVARGSVENAFRGLGKDRITY